MQGGQIEPGITDFFKGSVERGKSEPTNHILPAVTTRNGITSSMARQRIVHVLIQGPTSLRTLLFTFSSSAQLAHQELRCFFRSSHGAVRMGVP